MEISSGGIDNVSIFVLGKKTLLNANNCYYLYCFSNTYIFISIHITVSLVLLQNEIQTPTFTLLCTDVSGLYVPRSPTRVTIDC